MDFVTAISILGRVREVWKHIQPFLYYLELTLLHNCWPSKHVRQRPPFKLIGPGYNERKIKLEKIDFYRTLHESQNPTSKLLGVKLGAISSRVLDWLSQLVCVTNRSCVCHKYTKYDIEFHLLFGIIHLYFILFTVDVYVNQVKMSEQPIWSLLAKDEKYTNYNKYDV